MSTAEAIEWGLVLDRLEHGSSSSWKPFPKQKLASELAGEAAESLFGGAAGPGKTEWLMEYGIKQMEDHPGNRGIIFRRVYPSLLRTIIPRLKAKLSTRARWNGNEKTFTFPNGSILECSSLQYPDDVYDYQGAEYGWIGWEEVTEFAEEQYLYMLGRLRSPQDGIRPHSTATTNPGGRGHVWVKRRFVKPKTVDLPPGAPMPVPTEVWTPVWIPGIHDEANPPLTRCYIPATLVDNPKLLERDPSYLARLRAQTDRGKRLAYEKGDWDAIDEIVGALWTGQDLDGGRVDPGKQRRLQTAERVVAVDPSDGDEKGDGYGVAVCSRGADGIGYVEQSHEWHEPVRRMARRTIDLAESVGADAIVIEKNHGGKWMLEVFRQVNPYINLEVVWASDGKRTRARPVAALFAMDPDAELRYRAKLVGFHEELEEQLTTTMFDGTELSPDRLDAMVWGLSHLMLGRRTISRTDATEKGRDMRLRGRR